MMKLDDISVTATRSFVSACNISGSKSYGCAEMSDMGDYWFLNRCKVDKDSRGKGLGKALLQRLKNHARGKKIIVTPGGYNIPFEQQVAFYEKCEFEKVEEGHWEWHPEKQSTEG